MKEYVIAIIIVGIIGAVISILAIDGELQKQVRLAIGLTIVIVCVSPIVDAVRWLESAELGDLSYSSPDTGEYESIFFEYYSKAEIENCSEGIKSMLCESFEIDEGDLEVSVVAGEGKLERVYITLFGDAIWQDTAAMEEYLGGLLSCEIITVIG